MSSLAGGGLEATLVRQGCQWGEGLGLEQHRTRTGWNSLAPPRWPLTALTMAALSNVCFHVHLPDIMLISSVANSALKLPWEGNLGNVVLVWPS